MRASLVGQFFCCCGVPACIGDWKRSGAMIAIALHVLDCSGRDCGYNVSRPSQKQGVGYKSLQSTCKALNAQLVGLLPKPEFWQRTSAKINALDSEWFPPARLPFHNVAMF